MQRTDRERLSEAKAHEVPHQRLAVGVVHLVHDHQGGALAPLEDVGDAVVLLGGAGRGIHDEDHDVGFSDGPFALAGHLGVELGSTRHPTASVHEDELSSQPLGLDFLAVPGDAGLLFDDGLTAAQNPVDECGLADVGSASDDHGGELTHLSPLGVRREPIEAPVRRWRRPRRVPAGRPASCRQGTVRLRGIRRGAGIADGGHVPPTPWRCQNR